MRPDVLEAFAEAQHLVDRQRYGGHVVDWDAGCREPVESFRRAYRERHKLAGRCVSCPCPADADSNYCPRHRARNAARARASKRARSAEVR